MAKNYKTIPVSEIRSRYNPGFGRHFFDRKTMKFFNSRLEPSAYEGPGGVFFVSSEQMNSKSKRLWSVRRLVMREDGSEYKIDTLGHRCYTNAKDARFDAKRYADTTFVLPK